MDDDNVVDIREGQRPNEQIVKLIDKAVADVAAGGDTISIANFAGQMQHADLKYLSKAIASVGESVKTLKLPEHRLGEGKMPQVAEIVRKCPNLENLHLPSNRICTEGLGLLAEALKDTKSLTRLGLSVNRIGGAEGGALLADMIETHQLGSVNLAFNPLHNKALIAIATAIGKDEKLFDIQLGNNQQNTKGCTAILGALLQHNHLGRIGVTGFFKQSEQLEEFAKTLATGDNKNLFSIDVASCHTTKATGATKSRLDALKPLFDEPQESLDYSSLAALSKHHGAFCFLAQEKDFQTEQLRKFDTFLDGLPNLPAPTKNPLEALFAPDANGYAPLDNPRIWEKPEKVLTQLEEAGIVLDEATLAQRTKRGVSLLESALMGAPRGAITTALEARDIAVDNRQFIKDGKPSPLFKHYVMMGDAANLFTAERWQGQSPAALKTAYNALPDEQKEQVTNYHQLQHTLQRSVSEIGLGR